MVQCLPDLEVAVHLAQQGGQAGPQAGPTPNPGNGDGVTDVDFEEVK